MEKYGNICKLSVYLRIFMSSAASQHIASLIIEITAANGSCQMIDLKLSMPVAPISYLKKETLDAYQADYDSTIKL